MTFAKPSPFTSQMLLATRSLFARRPFRGVGRLTLAIAGLAGRKKLLLPTVTGSSMAFDFANRHEVWMFYDIFSRDLSDCITSLLKPGDVFVDCGANVGYFSYLASPLVGSAGAVLAIDPNPYCIQRIKESAAGEQAGNIRACQFGVGAGEGTLQFNVAEDPMYSSFADLDALSWTGTGKRETIDVQVCRLDDILDRELGSADRPIRFLKLDVEGAELDTLKGAERTLSERRVEHIFLELHPQQLRAKQQTTDMVTDLIESKGYGLAQRFGERVLLYSAT